MVRSYCDHTEDKSDAKVFELYPLDFQLKNPAAGKAGYTGVKILQRHDGEALKRLNAVHSEFSVRLTNTFLMRITASQSSKHGCRRSSLLFSNHNFHFIKYSSISG